MQKIIKEVDQKRGIYQITVSDERWYLKQSIDEKTGLPVYKGVPSVTWIGSYYPKGVGYYKWLGEHGWDESQALMREAGEKGSAVHKAIEMILDGMEFRIDTKVILKDGDREVERELTFEELECVKSFCDWRAEMEQDYAIETVRNGMVLVSDQHNYGGTLDWLLILTPKADGKNPLKLGGPTTFLLDFKTSQQVWTSAELQVSAYKRTIESGENPVALLNPNGTESGKYLDVTDIRIGILQVGYRLNKKKYKLTIVDDCFDMFLIAQKIWARENEGADVRVIDFPIVLSPGRKPGADPVIVAAEAPGADEGLGIPPGAGDDLVDAALDAIGEQSELPVGKKKKAGPLKPGYMAAELTQKGDNAAEAE